MNRTLSSRFRGQNVRSSGAKNCGKLREGIQMLGLCREPKGVKGHGRGRPRQLQRPGKSEQRERKDTDPLLEGVLRGPYVGGASSSG